MVLGQSARVAMIEFGIGLAIAAGATRMLASMLFDVGEHDPCDTALPIDDGAFVPWIVRGGS